MWRFTRRFAAAVLGRGRSSRFGGLHQCLSRCRRESIRRTKDDHENVGPSAAYPSCQTPPACRFRRGGIFSKAFSTVPATLPRGSSYCPSRSDIRLSDRRRNSDETSAATRSKDNSRETKWVRANLSCHRKGRLSIRPVRNRHDDRRRQCEVCKARPYESATTRERHKAKRTRSRRALFLERVRADRDMRAQADSVHPNRAAARSLYLLSARDGCR